MGASWIHPNSDLDHRVGSYLGVHERRGEMLERLVERLRDARAEDVRSLLTGNPYHPVDYGDYQLKALVHKYAGSDIEDRLIRGVVYYVDHSDCDLCWPDEQVELIADAFRELDKGSREAFFWQAASLVGGPVLVG